MPVFSVRHALECDEKTYWEKCVFDDEYNRRLYLEVLKFPGWKVIDQKVDAGKVSRSVHIDPPLSGLPGPLQKLVGDRFSYREDGTYDPSTGKYIFQVTPSTMAEKTKTSGELYCEKLGEKRVTRVASIRVDVSVFMVGKLVEEKIMGDLKNSYEAAAAFTNLFVKEKNY